MADKIQGRRSSWELSIVCAITFALALLLAPASSWADSVDSPHIRPTIDTDTCAACHTGHGTGAAIGSGVGVLREGDSGIMCLGCHSLQDGSTGNVVTGSRDSFGLASGHSMVTTATGSVQIESCSACHDAHLSSIENPGIPNAKVNGVNVAGSGPEICLACHDQNNSWFGGGYPSTSAPTRDATGYPVTGTWPGPDTYNSSDNAHRLIPESTQTIVPGREVKRRQGDCLYCHAAHRGTNAYDGLLTTYTVPAQSTLASDQAEASFAAECFQCHGGIAPSGLATAPVDIKRFVTATTTATGNYTGNGGHSIMTGGGTLPVGAPLPCFECHNPHGSSRGNKAELSDELGGSLETSTAAGVREFCFTCHSTNDTVAGWDSKTSSYVAVSSSDLIVGLPRDDGMLRLGTAAGHSEADTASCYTCHGNSYAAGGRNVHDPSYDGTLQVAVAPSPTVGPDLVAPVTVADLTAAAAGTVSLVATDTGSGVASTFFSLDGGVLTTGTVVVASGDGTHTVSFWSVDNASNVESPTIVAFLVDQTAPVTASDAVAAYVDTATVTLSSQDNTDGVGVAATYFRLDGGDVATGTIVTTSNVGTHTLDFWAVDTAGNSETTHTIDFAVSSSQAMVEPPPIAWAGATAKALGAKTAIDVTCRQASGWLVVPGTGAASLEA